MPPTLPPEPPSLARRIRRIILWTVIPFVVLVLGACPAENYRGHYLWNKYRKEWEAKGEQFDLMKLVPPPVPQDQNFASTPFFAPYLDYTIDETNRADPYRRGEKERYEKNMALAASLRSPQPRKKNSKPPGAGQWQIGTFENLKQWQDYFHGNTNFPFAISPKDPANDVLSALHRYDGVLDELRAASTRPYSRFPVHYQEHFQTLLPHLASLKNLAEVVRLRALAELEGGHPADALRDVELNLRFVDTIKSEHFLISQLVRMSIADLTLQPIWEGLARQRWNEAQITELQAALARINFLEDYGPTMRLERAIAIYYIDLLRTGKYREIGSTKDGGGESSDEESEQNYSRTRYLPDGVFRQNQLGIARAYQEEFIPLVNGDRHHVDVQEVERAASQKKNVGFRPYRLFADLLLPSASKSSERFARVQSGFDLALVACALERYRLADGSYPETLEALTPKFLATIPPDVITGKSLKYHLTGDGRFVLYSVGRNQTDDNGVPGLTERQKRFDPKKGDWVWSYPAVPSEKAKP